ncbi:MAG: hypothetical protein R2780_14410 [Crocinitomicaceae bacterium]|nr:hypothetical protein [Crocinitomicaceae bacterium]
MEKKRTYQWVCMVLFSLLISCQKHEVNTNKFGKQSRWQVTTIQIGSNGNSVLPKWEVSPSENAEEYGSAVWVHMDGSRSTFKWIFKHYQNAFVFFPDNSVEQDVGCKAYLQCSNLSGEYKIITDKSKMFEFESLETSGYPGISVFIQIQPM